MPLATALHPSHARRPLVYGVLAMGLAAHLTLLYSGALGAVALEWLPYTGWAIYSLAAGLRSLLAARHAQTRQSATAWIFFGLAALAWCAGIFYLMVGKLVDPSFETSPSPANYLFLAYAILFIPGLLALRPGQIDFSGGTVRLANLGAIASSVLLCAAIILLEPLKNTQEGIDFVVLAIADPAAFVTASLLALTVLWLEDLGQLRKVIMLLFLSIAVHTASNLAFFNITLESGTSGVNLDVFWLLAFALQYLAAFEFDCVEPSTVETAETRPAKSYAVLQALLPAVLIAGVLAIAVLNRDQMSTALAPVGITLAGIFAILLGLREWAIERHGASLLDDLQTTYALTAHALGTSPAVIFSCDTSPGHRVTFVSENAHSLLGHDAKTFTPQNHIHPDDLPTFSNDLHRAMEAGTATSEIRLANGDGHYRWVDQKLIVANSADGRPDEIVGSIMDITEQKALRSNAMHGQRLESLGQLSGSVAHDFNNLLTTVLGFTDILLSPGDLPPAEKMQVEEIKNACERGANLTRQLLTFSRRQAFTVVVVDLNEMIAGLNRMLQRLIGDNMTLHIITSPESCKVLADHGQLEQVVINLVLNARDAMLSDSEVVVEISSASVDEDAAMEQGVKSGRYAVISVKDTGPGMNDDVISHMFEPFFTTKEKGKGTGLGLATVHGVIRQHGGFIAVKSLPGVGSTFSVHLPASAEVAAA